MCGQQLRQVVAEHRVAIGTFLDLGEPLLVEMMGHLGYDFVCLEYEHGLRDLKTLQELIRAADSVGIPAIIRIGEATDNMIERMLDAGTAGFMVAHITSSEQAQSLVRASRYPPEGKRGAGFSRREQFGANPRYRETINQDILIWAIIEDPEGVENIDSIVTVEGIDGICPGPGDLAMSLGLRGLPGYTQHPGDHPEVRAMLQKVIDATRRQNKQLLGFATDPSQVEGLVGNGANVIVLGHDTRLIANYYRQSLELMRAAADIRA
jgi:2-keto-3-deoxy-L-rhamnonate aldolase RhmA